MKALFGGFLLCAVALLAGCNGSAPQLTFQQQVGIACGLINGEMTILQSDGIILDTTTQATVSGDVAKVCTAEAAVTVPNLQNLVNATLPLIKTFVAADSAIPLGTKNAVDAAMDTIVLAVNTAIALAPQATSTAPASSPTPASAPAAASGAST